MPTFATPGPVTATVEVAGAQVRVTASDRTETVVLVEPRDAASRKDVKVAGKSKVDLADGRLTVKTTTPGDKSGSGNIEVGISDGTAAYIDANSERGAVRNSVASPSPSPESPDATVTVHARTRHGDIIVHRAAR
ncbi:MAG: hypothetical protein ACRDPF_18820 [Streptosporangiaceae bacterium]